MSENNFDLDEFHKERLEFEKTLGFYEEVSESSHHHKLMMGYKKEFIQLHFIESTSVTNDGKLLIKWKKRFSPLTDEQYKDKFSFETK